MYILGLNKKRVIDIQERQVNDHVHIYFSLVYFNKLRNTGLFSRDKWTFTVIGLHRCNAITLNETVFNRIIVNTQISSFDDVTRKTKARS